MKYVFIVHSHTLFLTSLGVMDYLHLDRKEVILIHTRGYRTSIPVEGSKSIFADEVFDRYYDIKRTEKRWRIRKAIREFDRIANSWIGDSFELFVPHLWTPSFKLLQTHYLCERVAFVQEGAFTVANFFHNHFSAFRKWRMRLTEYLRWGSFRLYGNGWYTDGELVHQKELDAYAIYPQFFQYLKCRLHLVEWPTLDVPLPVIADGPVFIFDGFAAHGYCKRDFYLQTCRRMIDRFAGKKNYLKFHPAQKSDEVDSIIHVFLELDLEYEVLDNRIPFELVILSNNRLTVIGMGSSLLYFAKNRGHEVHCCDTWLMGDPFFQSYHDQGVPFFNTYFSLPEEQ